MFARLMDVRALRYFVEVVKRRGFTRAGESLHVTQPAISKMVAALEEELGAPLLVRGRRQVELTDAGRVVFERAQAVLDSIRGIEDEVAGVAALRRGHVRIGLPPMVGVAFFPPLLSEFRRAYPGVSLELREEGARRIEALVLERELDVGATVLPTDEAAFETMPFVEDVLQVVLPRHHPLAGRRAVALRDLARIPFVLYRPDFSLHRHILDACRRAGFTPQVASESSQWDFIAAMAASGVGVALLPATMCRQLDRAQVAVLRLSDPVLTWNLALIWRRGREVGPATRAWLELARRRLVRGAARRAQGGRPAAGAPPRAAAARGRRTAP
jgi:DNA-binding transcriptional LysR family regulator